jgi:UDP-galactopyranose mutase
VGDVFHSAVSRDVVPDPRFRGFAFHFRPDTAEERMLPRAAEVLGVSADDFALTVRYSMQLPSPRLGHAEIVADIDRAIAGTRLSVTGNYFAGMAIEDCVDRSKAEVARLR